MPEGTCKEDGCDRPIQSRQMCNKHYLAWWRNADPSELKYRRGQPKPPCKVEGCGQPRRAQGYCGKHYYHFRTKGNPLGAKYWNTGRIVTPAGYAKVWAPDHPLANSDGYVLEHRKVVHDAGLSVPAGHHVHHLNGDKLDNRLENLEVLSESEHHRQHVQEQGYIVNQYGTWPLRS